jgi:hypothetical protein
MAKPRYIVEMRHQKPLIATGLVGSHPANSQRCSVFPAATAGLAATVRC